jgi:hypothetical protein
MRTLLDVATPPSTPELVDGNFARPDDWYQLLQAIYKVLKLVAAVLMIAWHS